MEDYRFKVNLGGMIEILSDHLYSSPDVYIRELLQNAVDAITGLKQWKKEDAKDYEGKISIQVEERKSMVFMDNGQGLTESEIQQFLAIIGESSKHDLKQGTNKSDYIGRFGIGLLSCFMVSDDITMITKSCKSPDAPVLKWCGKPDGTYTIEEVPKEMFSEESGTKVILKAKMDYEEYFEKERIEELVVNYGILLHIPITISQNGESKQINPTYLPWEGKNADEKNLTVYGKNELMEFGEMMFNEQFFDCVPFHLDVGGISGVIYVLNYSVLPSATISHKIYLKNMLLTEKGDNLIPQWAVFMKCIINATDLRPTASREGFYVDDTLEKAREGIEDVIRNYIVGLAENEHNKFSRFFKIHNLNLMSIALSSQKLFETLIDYFEFETTRGMLTGYDLKTSKEPLIYAPSSEKYEQLSQLFFAQDKLLINVSYVHAYDLLYCLGQVYSIEVNAVEECDIDKLMSDLSPDDADAGFDFLKEADRILQKYDCKAELKYFSPNNQPTFYLINENVILKRQIENSREQADSMFFSMLDSFAADISNDTAATLYFNYNNPVVKKIVEVNDNELLKVIVEILYVQALQIGGFSLHNNEMGMLSRNIIKLIDREL